MRFSILTIHPRILRAFAQEGLLKRAQEQNLITLDLIDLRRFADPPHYRVDDRPYGGGAGMILRCEPIVRALRSLKTSERETKKIVVLSAKAKRFTQSTARNYARFDHLILICGRYEGVDERIIEYYADEERRIGDYVLMGGELPAGVVVETVSRLVPGVLGNQNSLEEESFSPGQGREYAQYTRPREFEGCRVPEVLLSGDHQKIQRWRKRSS